MLATDISASSCLTLWLSGVSSKGTLNKAKEMTSLPFGDNGIPSGWTVKNYETNISNSDKKLVGMTYNKYSSDGVISLKNIVTFTYDDKDRLIAWEGTQHYLKESTTLKYNHTLTWNGNKCTETTDYDEDIVCHYVFENNMMKSSTWGPWTQTFTYNNAKQLIRADHTFTDGEKPHFETFTWEGEKLMSGGDGATLTYSNQTINGFNPAIFLFENDILEDVNLALTNPELVGLKINHLVSSIIDESNYVWNFTYTLYDDGYIKSCTMVKTKSNGDKYKKEYTFEWE
jgi:hypothetical protein